VVPVEVALAEVGLGAVAGLGGDVGREVAVASSGARPCSFHSWWTLSLEEAVVLVEAEHVHLAGGRRLEAQRLE
jgi:hypothetical protein